MLLALRRVFRPNAHTRRVLSGLCAAFVLATLAFSSVFVATEADHDCGGQDCPVCQEIQTCIENFQLVGSAPASDTSTLPEICHFTVEAAPCARRAPVTTLQTLDVRFDE